MVRGVLALMLIGAPAARAQDDENKVLLEVYTGAWCAFCPDGFARADSLQETWGERLVVVYAHEGDGMAFSPSPIQEIEPTGYPTGTVDRGDAQSRGDWPALVAARMALAPGASLHLLQRYETGTRNLEVEATATFAQAAVGATQLRLHLVEDGVTGSGTGWDQANYYHFDTGPGALHPYAGAGNPILGFEHRRVLRATPVGVDDDGAVAAGAVEGQTEAERWEFTLPAGWDPDTMSAVVFLVDKDVPVGIRRVWQVEEIDVGAEAAYDLLGTTGSLDEAQLDFGSLLETSSEQDTITVMSTGTRPLEMGAMQPLQHPAYTIVDEECSERSHDPGQDCTITVKFDPAGVGTALDAIRIPYAAVGGAELTVYLAGVGTFDGSYTVADGPSADFGDVRVGRAADTIVTLNSTGPGSLALSEREALQAPFSVVADACGGASHAPSATCAVTVRFAPTAAGDATGTLRIPFDVSPAGGAVEVPLEGRGNLAPVTVDDAYTVVAGETLEVDAPGVLANDSDPESDTIIATVDEGLPGIGMTILGAFSLPTAASDAGTTLEFTYKAEDALGSSLPATVRVTVTAPEVDDDDDDDVGRCGCAAGPPGGLALIALAGLFARRRRA